MPIDNILKENKLFQAIYNRDDRLFRTLIRKELRMEDSKYDMQLSACELRDPQSIGVLNQTASDGKTTLLMAIVLYDAVNCLSGIMFPREALNSVDEQGFTPLLKAAQLGNHAMVNALRPKELQTFDMNASPTDPEHQGKTLAWFILSNIIESKGNIELWFNTLQMYFEKFKGSANLLLAPLSNPEKTTVILLKDALMLHSHRLGVRSGLIKALISSGFPLVFAPEKNPHQFSFYASTKFQRSEPLKAAYAFFRRARGEKSSLDEHSIPKLIDMGASILQRDENGNTAVELAYSRGNYAFLETICVNYPEFLAQLLKNKTEADRKLAVEGVPNLVQQLQQGPQHFPVKEIVKGQEKFRILLLNIVQDRANKFTIRYLSILPNLQRLNENLLLKIAEFLGDELIGFKGVHAWRDFNLVKNCLTRINRSIISPDADPRGDIRSAALRISRDRKDIKLACEKLYRATLKWQTSIPSSFAAEIPQFSGFLKAMHSFRQKYKKDHEKEYKHYIDYSYLLNDLKATEKGLIVAQFDLSELYRQNERSLSGNEKNKKLRDQLRFFWCKKAADQKFPPAIVALAICYRDNIGIYDENQLQGETPGILTPNQEISRFNRHSISYKLCSEAISLNYEPDLSIGAIPSAQTVLNSIPQFSARVNYQSFEALKKLKPARPSSSPSLIFSVQGSQILGKRKQAPELTLDKPSKNDPKQKNTASAISSPHKKQKLQS